MGTRSTTAILDERGIQLVKIYRQYDGYLSGHGQELADFLNSKRLINGYANPNTTTECNGMGCLAAMLIGHLKQDRIGNIYITTPESTEEYDYTIYPKDNRLYIKAESVYDGVVYNGLASEFDGSKIEKEVG